MTEYTPTTKEVREAYESHCEFWCDRCEGNSEWIHGAEFDRLLASVMAEAWDEGHATPRELDPFDGHTFTAVNPYREVSK